MRVENTIKNLKYSYILKAISMLLHLITRAVFIKFLSVELLGANGLFSNIIGILSFADLGIGSAITFSLYKPLEQGDSERIKTLVHLYKKCYTIAGFFILIMGLCLIPLLPSLTNHSTLPNINEIYCLFLLVTVVSYFTADKQSLLIADQKQYVVSKISIYFEFIQCILQIAAIIILKNYIAYLLVQLICQIGTNIMIRSVAMNQYHYLADKNVQKLGENDRNEILKNIKAMFMHKVGGVLVNNTDYIIISSFIGLKIAGIASNYTLIISYISMILLQISNSTVASVGNLAASDTSIDYQYRVFQRLDFLNYSLYFFATVFLSCCMSPLISLLGKEYSLDNLTIFIMCSNFMISGYRIIVNQFKQVSGLFYFDRYKSLCEALVNIVTSLILVKTNGLLGVYLGTLICQLSAGVWWEQIVLFKHYFHMPSSKYHVQWFGNLAVTMLTSILCSSICQSLNMSGIKLLLMTIVIALAGSTAVYLALYKKKEEYSYFIQFLKMHLHFGK